jgi:peptide/nickel transport system permease protein
MKPQTFWQRLARAVRDRSFVVGSALVAIFLLVAILGPEVAPHNPYLRDRVQTIDGELQRAPIPPGDLYPLGTDDQGRDMLSMLLHGARQTLVIACVSMTVRLLLGLLLGAVAGWWPGSLFDRAVTGLIAFLAAIPGLILAMLLVFAVGIRRGQVSFIVALSLVGWGEVAQIVRGTVMVIRNKLYILAARAVGLGSAQILSRHVLPNLLATLLALAALEMGGVLLLLGELGFVHVFVGGGGYYADDSVEVGQMIHYFDVPDWGAMLGTSWRYFRARPWLPMAPALAFFVAILGFNLFGYGLQRFVEKGRFHPSGWSLFWFFVVVMLILFGARAFLETTGIEAQFTDLARQFNVGRAWDDMTYLTRPDLEGPSEIADPLDTLRASEDISCPIQPGSEGRPTGLACRFDLRHSGSNGARLAWLEVERSSPRIGRGFHAAGYIAYQFQQARLTPLPQGEYFQYYLATRGRVTAEPLLHVLDVDGELRMRVDRGISFDPLQPFETEGSSGEDELVVLGNTRGVGPVSGVVLLLDPTEVLRGSTGPHSPYAAVLRLVPDDDLWYTNRVPPFHSSSHTASFPALLIGESAAQQLLTEAGLDLGELQAALGAGERINLPTGLQVRVRAGLAYEEVPAVNVVGYFPAADRSTEGDRILLTATYGGPSSQASVVSPRADHNVSGVAVMLEVARLWRDLGFEPKRTVVFAAFDEGGGKHFIHNPIIPTGVSDTWTAVTLHRVGEGQPRLARREIGSGLARAFDQSARRFGVRTEELDEWRFFFTGGSERIGYVTSDASYAGLAVVRPEDDLFGVPTDGLDQSDPELLAEAGRTVAHYLMVLSSR